jgi:DNA-binding transcriptional regulator LsrR (DeoR family)
MSEKAMPILDPSENHFEETATLAVDRDEQLATRAAWLYFVAGLTQVQIAKKLGVNRIRVNRLLSQAREQGMVQIRITGRLAECVALEQRMRETFGVGEAIVVPTPPDQALVHHVIAAAAGEALTARLQDGMSVGVGWGRTLRLSLRSVPRRPLKRLEVVSLLGGLTRGSAMNPFETATHLADLVGAQCYYIAAPALAGSVAARDLLMEQPMIRDVLERARKVDLAFISVGALAANATIQRLGLIDQNEAEILRKHGAVGDLSVHWLNEQGKMVDHPLNQRAVTMPLEYLNDVPCVMIASGGKDKVSVLHGALRLGVVDVVITDEATAAGVLEIAGHQPA